MLLGVSVLAGVLGCGQGAPDSQSNNNPPIGMSEPAGLQASPALGNPTNSVTTRGLLPSPPGFSALPKGQISGSNHKDKTADDSEAQDRLNALNILAKQGFRGGDAPLIQALNDSDERVRARAQELMVEDWPVEIASGDQASK